MSLTPPIARSASHRRSLRERGQSLVEFTIVLPILLFMVVGIADAGRLYNAAVAVESAAREAADYGSFDATYWAAANVSDTMAAMEKRACTAAMGSHLEGYAGATDGTTCTNPGFECWLEWSGSSTPCASSGGFAGAMDCTNVVDKNVDTCTVHVRMSYEFRTILGIAPIGPTITLARDSRYRVADLTTPGP